MYLPQLLPTLVDGDELQIRDQNSSRELARVQLFQQGPRKALGIRIVREFLIRWHRKYVANSNIPSNHEIKLRVIIANRFRSFFLTLSLDSSAPLTKVVVLVSIADLVTSIVLFVASQPTVARLIPTSVAFALVSSAHSPQVLVEAFLVSSFSVEPSTFELFSSTLSGESSLAFGAK